MKLGDLFNRKTKGAPPANSGAAQPDDSAEMTARETKRQQAAADAMAKEIEQRKAEVLERRQKQKDQVAEAFGTALSGGLPLTESITVRKKPLRLKPGPEARHAG